MKYFNFKKNIPVLNYNFNLHFQVKQYHIKKEPSKRVLKFISIIFQFPLKQHSHSYHPLGQTVKKAPSMKREPSQGWKGCYSDNKLPMFTLPFPK